MDIELLGPPGVLGDDGVRRKVAGRQRALLAVLVLHARRPVSADRLVDVLWGEDAPVDPANALQQRISSLRKVIDPDRRGDVLVTTPGGYALRIDEDRIDAHRFARRAARGSELLATGDPAGAFAELTAALELWKGDPLDGFADEPWARADVGRLTELRLVAIEDRNDAALAHGAGGELLGDLTELVAHHPLRERLAGQLMLALYRDGRQADALEVYDRTRRRLADELGVDPGPALQTVYRQLLDQDLALDAHRTRSPTPSTRVDNLPASSLPLIGRDDALARVDQLLSRGRLVTLTGPGGTGKTSLAIEAARRRARPVHGTWLVELARLSDADAITSELASVLDVGAGGLGAAGVDVGAIAAALADRQLLLVIDNCEHVVDQVAEVLGQLLAAAPGLTVLATSREPIGVPGELVWSLPALAMPDPDDTDVDSIVTVPAVQLLIDRVRHHDPWFDLHAEDAAIAAALVRQLDGIPLAIELAAAQLRILSLAELTASLRDRFTILTSTVRTAPARQRSLRGALDWSWDLLDTDQRAAWATLAVPASWFDQAAAARLLAAGGFGEHPVGVVRALVDRSLLVAETRAGTARYRMLESIRTYGRGELDSLGRADPVRAAHADLVEESLAACHTTSDPSRFGVDLAGLARWLDDARAALTWADAIGERRRVQRIAGQLGWLWLLGGLASEGLGWLDRGLGDPAQLEAERVDPAAVLWASGLRLGQAHADGPRWAEIALTAVSDPRDHVIAAVYAAVHQAHAGRSEDAARQLAVARAEAEQLGGWPLGFCRLISAQLGRLTGSFDRIRDDAEVALDLLTGPGLEWARAYAIDIVIDAVLEEADPSEGYERARELAVEGLALCVGRRLPELEARLRLQLGRVLHELGDVERGGRHLDEAVRLAASAGPGAGLGFALLVAGRAARQRGDLEVAATQLRDAVDLLQHTGTPFGSAEANVELALTGILSGDARAAVAHAARGLGFAHRMGEPGTLARALVVNAGAMGLAEAPAAAAAFLAAASVLRDQTGTRPDRAEQRDLDGIVDDLRVRVGPSFDDRVADASHRASADLHGAIQALVAEHGTVGDSGATGP